MEVLQFLFGIFGWWYGLPFVSPNNILVSTINGTGAAIEAVYVIVFLAFAPKKARARMAGLFALVLSIFVVIALVSLLALRGQDRKVFCGVAATFFSICMYASPLSIMVSRPPFLSPLFHVEFCRTGTEWVRQRVGGDAAGDVRGLQEELGRRRRRRQDGGDDRREASKERQSERVEAASPSHGRTGVECAVLS
ncbi:hypothetical protein BHE74_00056452 [Ensete ventricosum]|nr:hypothetical protein BHE74_00056452 [Ensete ventricosum]RZS22544.1 hypothetical protein BHM03_00055328 [Ensete ventricosum]